MADPDPIFCRSGGPGRHLRLPRFREAVLARAGSGGAPRSGPFCGDGFQPERWRAAAARPQRNIARGPSGVAQVSPQGLAEKDVVLDTVQPVLGKCVFRLPARILGVEPELKRDRASAVADLVQALHSAGVLQRVLQSVPSCGGRGPGRIILFLQEFECATRAFSTGASARPAARILIRRCMPSVRLGQRPMIGALVRWSA